MKLGVYWMALFCCILLPPDKQEHMDVLLRLRVFNSSGREIACSCRKTPLGCQVNS